MHMAAHQSSSKEALRSVVVSCFSAILSGNHQQMKDAEEELKVLQVTEDFGLVLAEITVAPDGPVPYRQLASVILKQYVKNHWAQPDDFSELTLSDTKMSDSLPGEATKVAIRQILLHGLGDPLSKIRTTVAYAISAIAQTDWPENWPDLFDHLMAGLSSGSPELVHGTMRVLTEFCHEVTDSHIPHVAPVILSQLLRVISEPQVVGKGADFVQKLVACPGAAIIIYSIRTRSRAVNIFTTLTRLIHTVNSSTPNTAQSFFFPYLPSYIETFVRILNSTDDPNTDPGLRKEIILSLSKVIECFSSVVRQHLVAMVTPVWQILVNNIAMYVHSVINSADSSGDVYDSDGEEINFDSVLVAMFQFITALLVYGQQPHIFSPLLSDLVYHLITLMQITMEQVSRWESDIYKYLEEDESELSYSIRLLAFDLLVELLDSRSLGGQVYQAICSTLERHLTESARGEGGGRERGGASANEAWWKIHEACFLVVGLALLDSNKSTMGSFSCQVFVENVLLTDISLSSSPILTGRCIWLAGKLCSQLNPETIQRCLESALSGLQVSQHMIVRAMSAKAVFYFCEQLKEDRHRNLLSPFLPHFISLLCDMASDSQEILLFTILDSLQLLCQVDDSITASHSERLIPLMVALFLKYCHDPAVSSCIEDMFICLSNNRGCHPLLHSRFLPTAIELLSASESQIPQGMVSSTLEILVVIIRGCDSPLPQPFINSLFTIVVQRVLLSEDAAILQNGGECIRAFLSKASDQLVEWRDSSGRSGLHYATEVVMHLLDPARPEYSAAFVDKLIIVFVKKAGGALGTYLELLLRSVLSKMQQAETPSVMQSLLIVFAHLASTEQLEGLISFLSQVPDPTGRPALEYVVTQWCSRHSFFFGHYEQRVSTVALCQLLSHCLNTGDQRLNSIVVTEEDTSNQSDGIITRSKKASAGSSQWTEVPLPVKLTKVLIGELKSQLEEEEANDEDEDEQDEEEDTWSSDVQVGDMASTLEELYQSGIGEDGTNSDEGDDDPDLKDEALLKIDLHSHLVHYFTELCHHTCFQSLLPHLSLYEKRVLCTVGALTPA